MKNNEENQDPTILKQGTFYSVIDGNSDIILEDRTKRGLTVKERSNDEKYNVDSDKGIIYDMEGVGHKVGIRWYFPKNQYVIEKVYAYANDMEQRYKKIREETCPDY